MSQLMFAGKSEYESGVYMWGVHWGMKITEKFRLGKKRTNIKAFLQ